MDLMRGHGGEDFAIYLRHTREWLDGGSFHDTRQLTGETYTLIDGDSLYPPPFALVMLPFLILAGRSPWWVCRPSSLAAVIYQHRPARVGHGRSSRCASRRRARSASSVYGNPSMWLAAIGGAVDDLGLARDLRVPQAKPRVLRPDRDQPTDRNWWIACGRSSRWSRSAHAA